MANEIFGDGATVLSATYAGDNDSSGIFTDGDTVAPGATPSDTGVILSTGDAEDYTNATGEFNQRTNTSSNTSGVNNDPQFNALAGAPTRDASILEVTFQTDPTTTTLSFQFIYGSEEYPEFVGSTFIDTVGVWINGTAVDLAVGAGDSNVDNISPLSNSSLYVDNTGDAFNTEMDGFTATLTLTLNVIPNAVNTIRIGIADVADSNFDSNLLIAGGSIQNTVLAADDNFTAVLNGTPLLNVLANDTESSGGTLTLTHINGQPVTVGVPILLPTGEQLSVNADGTINLINDNDLGLITFSYTTQNAAGVSDTAFVNITTVPCFLKGTRLKTSMGWKRVEDVSVGDMVKTLDNGFQSVRWIGFRQVDPSPETSPILISANSLGDHGDIWVSPQHRVLIRDHRCALMFGEEEVFIAAKDLQNSRTIRTELGCTNITYFHVMLDTHQVIDSEGLLTESFQPGPHSITGFSSARMDEIRAVFPAIDPETGLGYGAAARTTIKAFEAQMLTNMEQVA